MDRQFCTESVDSVDDSYHQMSQMWHCVSDSGNNSTIIHWAVNQGTNSAIGGSSTTTLIQPIQTPQICKHWRVRTKEGEVGSRTRLICERGNWLTSMDRTVLFSCWVLQSHRSHNTQRLNKYLPKLVLYSIMNDRSLGKSHIIIAQC